MGGKARSLDLDDDLALGAAFLDVSHRLVGRFERKDLVYQRAYRATLDLRCDLTQLAATAFIKRKE